MKLKFIYALAIAGALSTFTSCSDDDPAPGSSLEQKTYSSDDLTLNFNGAPLIGKTVTFTPGNDGKGTVTLAGESLDPSQILDMITRAAADDQPTRTIPTAGVLPGSPSVSIPVELKGDANNCTFEGTNETEYCTYSYSGSVTADNFEFNLSDVKLKNTSLAGTWTFPESKGSVYNVARIEWDYNSLVHTQFSLMPGVVPPTNIDASLEWFIRLALVMPMIKLNEDEDTAKSPLDVLTTVLKSVTLGEDGNVTAEYLDTKTGEIVTAPTGIAQYVVSSNNTLRLFLNPAAIIANSVSNTKTNTRAADFSILVEGLMTELMPMLTDGIPVNYGAAIPDPDAWDESEITNGDATAFYLGTETLLPIFKALLPLFSDEEFIKSLVEEASKDPSMGMFSSSLEGILKSLPEVIKNTTKVEIGINLKK